VVIRGDSGCAIHEGKNCWMSWIMGRDDGAGLVRYANSSANLRGFSCSRVELPLPTHMRC
jgi:hypothetical protein